MIRLGRKLVGVEWGLKFGRLFFFRFIFFFGMEIFLWRDGEIFGGFRGFRLEVFYVW